MKNYLLFAWELFKPFLIVLTFFYGFIFIGGVLQALMLCIQHIWQWGYSDISLALSDHRLYLDVMVNDFSLFFPILCLPAVLFAIVYHLRN